MDRRARWGVVLQALAYSLLWQGDTWSRPPVTWRLVLSIMFLALAGAFSWTGARALGSHWRIDAGLNTDHELVRSGPYRIVRHPIYASMFCLLLGTGFMITPPLFFVIATVVFVIGTEIRIRVEDALLESHFGDQFREYRGRVSAYIPFLRYSRR